MYHFEDIAPIPPFPTDEPGFVNELRKYPRRQPHWKEFSELPVNTIDLRNGWKIEPGFPDPDGLLTSAYDALEKFKMEHIKNIMMTL